MTEDPYRHGPNGTGFFGSGVAPRPKKPGVLLPAALFIITVFTTIVAGAMYQGADLLNNPGEFTRGIPFSVSLLLILGTHELGHYIASRKHGVATTLPVFIPGPPFPPMIGTFGAVIRIKSPITTKNALVDIGAAGPLSGFAVALAVTYEGLRLSKVLPKGVSGEALGLGSSLIFQILSYLSVGPVPEGFDVFLHPVAFAGWIGMFVTAMNLMPIGQLDGGHMVYALLGPWHRIFSVLMVAFLAVLGLLTWPGWFIWAALISIIGLRHPPIEDQHLPLDGRRKLICVATILVFILTFMPTPFYII